MDLGATQAILDNACSTFQGRLQEMLPAPICYLYIVLSNNVQMSWSTTRQTLQDVVSSRTQGSESPYGALDPRSVYTPLDHWEHSQLILKYTA